MATVPGMSGPTLLDPPTLASDFDAVGQRPTVAVKYGARYGSAWPAMLHVGGVSTALSV